MKVAFNYRFWVMPLLVAAFQQGCTNKHKEIHLPPNLTIKSQDLEFGQQQVDQMMHDRSAMATCVGKNDIIYEWASRQFAGEAVGKRIYWSAEPPDCPPECLSINHIPSKLNSGYIRIREQYAAGSNQGQNLPCEMLWSCAVYELFNVANAPEWSSNDELACSGKETKQEWIMNMTKMEFKAVQKTAKFYHHIWRPWAETKGIPTTDRYWFANEPNTYESWMQQYKDPKGYPYSYYGRYYDEQIAPYLQSKKPYS